MAMSDHSPILPEPLPVGPTRTCLACGRRFALELQRTTEDARMSELRVYHCRHCGQVFEFAEHLPDDTV